MCHNLKGRQYVNACVNVVLIKHRFCTWEIHSLYMLFMRPGEWIRIVYIFIFIVFYSCFKGNTWPSLITAAFVYGYTALCLDYVLVCVHVQAWQKQWMLHPDANLLLMMSRLRPVSRASDLMKPSCTVDLWSQQWSDSTIVLTFWPPKPLVGLQSFRSKYWW